MARSRLPVLLLYGRVLPVTCVLPQQKGERPPFDLTVLPKYKVKNATFFSHVVSSRLIVCV